MKNIIYTLMIVSPLLFGGCDNDHDDLAEERNSSVKEIMLSSKSSSLAISKATTTFPNNGSIGVVGALYNESGIDWTSYPDLTNVEATATSENNGVYSFNWKTPKYWPFDETQLVFLAYSPHDTVSNSIVLANNRYFLLIALADDLPDVMYASADTIASTTPYQKDSIVVNLGEFQHILSQLTVEVVAGDTMPATVVVSNLYLETPMRTASLDLLEGEDGLFVVPASTPFQYLLVKDPTPFKSKAISNTVYLFPGTEESVDLHLTLVDTSNGNSTTRVLNMSDFINQTTSGEPMTLERAKRTTLQIKVVGVPVRNPNDAIILKGTLSEWDYRGDFGIGIK